MIYEIAEIEVKQGSEKEFEAAVAQASACFADAKGCRSLNLQRSIERPTCYRLVVGWNCVDDHMVTFRESEGFQQWRRLAGPHFAQPPKVEHVDTVYYGFSQ
ncbi:MAG: antibiotic biosynthesis monooxygenase [Gammaproteobacteria bacterium]|nr:antibiotic biosynthesis monooxygenase [Gammaproteobacteria bacterium]